MTMCQSQQRECLTFSCKIGIIFCMLGQIIAEWRKIHAGTNQYMAA